MFSAQHGKLITKRKNNCAFIVFRFHGNALTDQLNTSSCLFGFKCEVVFSTWMDGDLTQGLLSRKA